MTRSQYCREHIDKVAEECGLEKSTVSDVKQAAKFCDQYSEFSDCSTHAIMALIRIRDEQVKARAISLAENHLKQTTPTGGKKQKFLTEREVRTFIKKADLEVRKEIGDERPSITAEPEKIIEKFLEVSAGAESKAPVKSPGPGWHPSTNNCRGCAVLGYEKDPKSRKFVHICTVAKPADGYLYGRTPYGMEKCPLGTGPVKVGCQFWGDDTLCHNPHGLECTASTRGKYHCPLTPGSGGFSPALELMRRQAYRNPQTGGLTTDYCRNKPGVDGCPHLKKREMNNTLECELAGKVPGNLLTCPLDEKKDSEKPSDEESRIDKPVPDIKDDPLTEEDPGWQPFLNRQIRRCREKKCPHLIDEEGDVSGVCLEMEAREKDRHPWRRYDCPLRPDIPASKPGSTGMGMTVREGPKRPEPRISLFEREKSVPDRAAGPFRVAVTRGQEPIIRQMVKYQIADDEAEAAQMAFDRGLVIILDEIEVKFQAEGEKS